MVVPHASIPFQTVRTADIILLLLVGTITEVLTRLLVRSFKVRSSREIKLREKLRLLRYETMKKRAQGPSAFVETAKLERRVLASEKEIKEMEEVKKARIVQIEKSVKYARIAMSVMVFVLYYGIPILTIDGLKASLDANNAKLLQNVKVAEGVAEDVAHATALMRNVIWPLGSVGPGMKFASIGLGELKYSSIGALVVYWSAQATSGKVYDCLEALSFR
eukprot:277988_1